MKQMTALFEEIFREEKLIKMIFGGKRKKSQECQKASIRPVRIAGQLVYQVEEGNSREPVSRRCHEEVPGPDYRRLQAD